MIILVQNPYTNPDYSNYMNDEDFINWYLKTYDCRLISAFWNVHDNCREFVVEDNSTTI